MAPRPGRGRSGPFRFKFHAFGHYVVSGMLQRSVPLPEVASYIGDHIETVTKVYAHFLGDAPRTATAALDPGSGARG
jgi:hypothetical protein